MDKTMNSNLKEACLLGTIAGLGGFDPFGLSYLNCDVRPIPGTVTIPKHGKPGSRMESVRAHHTEVQRKKRARKNKRGY